MNLQPSVGMKHGRCSGTLLAPLPGTCKAKLFDASIHICMAAARR